MMYSLRDLLKFYPQGAALSETMTTSTLGLIFPDFVTEYGRDQEIDFVVSPSHSLFKDGMPNSKPSGIYMDKSGNWKGLVNIPIQINVKKRLVWEEIRNVYLSILVKAQLKWDAGICCGHKTPS